MSHTHQSASSPALTDKEIAEDILTGKKYLSNYYYAPAVLETSNLSLRNTFQQVHNESQSEAKRVFDYLSERGYYKPKPADAQDMNDLKNTVKESQQTVTKITGQTSIQQGGGQQMHQFGNIQQGAQFQGQGNLYQANRHGQWVGDQIGEGQSGMGPSSLAQGAKWGGQPSWNQQQGYGISQNYGRQFLSPGQQQFGGQQSYGQLNYSQSGQWVGDQIGEGQSGMGPSSLAQGAHWGGQPSWMGQNVSQMQKGQNLGQQNIAQPGFGQNLGQQGFQFSLGQQNLKPQNLGQQYFSTSQGSPGNFQPRYSQSGQWVGDQIGEGRRVWVPAACRKAQNGAGSSWNV